MRIKILVLGLSCLFLSFCSMLAPKPLSPEELAYLEKVKAFPIPDEYSTGFAFRVPREEAEDAWGRINVFIEKWSNMKVERITDYVIETYKLPETDGCRFGYRAIKTPMGDEVKFEVRCWSSYPTDKANVNAHILAYYAKTGTLKSKFVEYYGKRPY